MEHPSKPVVEDPSFKLRPYQLDAVSKLKYEYNLGRSAVLLVAPTGSGKTAVGCHFVKEAVEQGKTCLWIAHRSELIRQASNHLAQEYKVRHGIIKAGVGNHNPRLRVQIASVQTLVRRKPIDGVGLLVVDEAHHATADTYLRIIESHPNAIVLGLTATPWRLTGKQLGSLFDVVVEVANYPFLIERGYLVRPRVFLPSEIPNFSELKLVGGDFDEEQSATIMQRPKLIGDVFEQWKKHALGEGKPRSTIIFACTVPHSRQIVSLFIQAGIAAEHLDAQVPEKEREAILDRLATGKTTVVCNVMLLSEGFDCPLVSCVVIARPTASRTLFIQMVGRALRPCAASRKSDCIILDHAANSLRHGMVSEITSYELDEGDLLTPSINRAPCKKCPLCNAVVTNNSDMCPECNYSFHLDRRLPSMMKGELVEFDSAPHSNVTMPSQNRESTLLSGVDKLTLYQDSPISIGMSYESALKGLNGPASEAYREFLLTLNQRNNHERLLSIIPALSRLSASEKMGFVTAGLLSEQSHEWLQDMNRAGCLKYLGLGCLEEMSSARMEGYNGLTFFERTKRSLRRTKPDLVLKFAALLFGVGAPRQMRIASKHGFKTVRGYTQSSVELASESLRSMSLGGEIRECVLELILHHEYLFDQILNQSSNAEIPKLCERWRKKLGPLWKQHFEFAEALWDGKVLKWIHKNYSALCQGFDSVEGEIFAMKPEEHCPLDGNTIMARYKMLSAGPWITGMKSEIGKWCMANPIMAQDSSSVFAAADEIFAHYRKSNSSAFFNRDKPFLHLDEEQLLSVPDPFGVRNLLIEASKLKVGNVSEWAAGYRRKAVVSVVNSVARETNSKQTTSLCAIRFLEFNRALEDISLGELLRAMVQTNGLTHEIVEAVRSGRHRVALLRKEYQKGFNKDSGLQFARALRDLGHFKESLEVITSICTQYPEEPSAIRLLEKVRKYITSTDDESP
jgi:DNA repair protein RadD